MCNLSPMRLFMAAALLLAVPSYAEEAKPDVTSAKGTGASPAFELPQDSVTQHTIQLNGKPLAYKATAGTLPVTGAKGEMAAKIFYVSYTADSGSPRPITFAFNGGPGAAAAFLHMGAIGPRIVPFKENGAAPVRPIRITDNPDSWLAFTDLVFIDPVGTGYSRALAGGVDAEKAFWSIDKDVASIAEAVRLYLLRNGRELAPVYLVDRI
jgi:carboxypeptidase C (cathepsin A)